jgi:hypothetical protein
MAATMSSSDAFAYFGSGWELELILNLETGTYSNWGFIYNHIVCFN